MHTVYVVTWDTSEGSINGETYGVVGVYATDEAARDAANATRDGWDDHYSAATEEDDDYDDAFIRVQWTAYEVKG